MWDVSEEKLGFEVKPGFRVKEDEEFVYLFYEEKEVASFIATSVDPTEIRRAMRAHLVKVRAQLWTDTRHQSP